MMRQRSQGLQACAASLLFGAVAGMLAWGEGRAPTLAILLPLVIAISPRRHHAILFVFAYELALLRTHPSFLAGWFGDNVFIGWLMASAYALATAAVWSVGWAPERVGSPTFLGRQRNRVVAMAIAWLLALIPPFAVFMPAHPVIGWGYVAPGWGWFGVIASVAVPIALSLAWFRLIDYRKGRAIGLSAIVLVLSVLGLRSGHDAPGFYGDVAAASTAWGRTSDPISGLRSIENIGAFIRRDQVPGVNTIFWPESIVGFYDPSIAPVVSMEILSPARARNQVQVVGMDIRAANDGFKSVAVAYYPDGRTAVAQARQPAIVSLWHPWKRGSYEANWSASNTLLLPDGRKVAILFCYEEYIPVLFLMSQAFSHPDLWVAMTNTWAASSSTASSVQTAHSVGMTRLFGMPFIKAENRSLQAAPNGEHS